METPIRRRTNVWADLCVRPVRRSLTLSSRFRATGGTHGCPPYGKTIPDKLFRGEGYGV